MAQWTRIQCRVQSLVPEDSMRLRAAKPAHHSSRAGALDPGQRSSRAGALEPGQRSSRAGVLQVLSPRALELVLHNQRTQSNEQPTHHSKEEAPLTTLRGESAHSQRIPCDQK